MLDYLAISAAAERLGVLSRNAYARYERGKATPTVDKLCQLLRAVGPELALAIA